MSGVATPPVRAVVNLPAPTVFRDARLLPGELPQAGLPVPDAGPAVLTVDQAAMTGLATRALAAGEAGQTAIGVASLNHGEGATTVARSLAACLATSFGKRVVLVEANQRSPSLRQIYGLPEAPGLAEVMDRKVSLGGALQMTGEHRHVLVLPASLAPSGGFTVAALQSVLAALLGHADAVVVDLAPLMLYRDSFAMCGALDGMALVRTAK
jgi:Mrp family chromosome partitioning ATPase